MTLPEIRSQSDLKCCYNCKYIFIDYDGDEYCALDWFDSDEDEFDRNTLIDVFPTSICDAFEQGRD